MATEIFFFFNKQSNNQHTKQKKKCAMIVQQTVWITDSVATVTLTMHQCAHYRAL